MRSFKIYIVLVSVLIFVGCKSTRNVPDGSYLLTKVEVKNTAKGISKDSYKPFIKQNPNVTILGGVKFHLWLYNLAGKDSSKWLNKKLKSAGEAPVIYDSFLADQSLDQLSIYMRNKGYYHSVVVDSVKKKSLKKLRVIYNINAGNQFKVNDFAVQSNDSELEELVKADSLNSKLSSGSPFDVSLHDAERDRITKYLQENGYYGFSKEAIHFKVDTTVGNYLVNDSLIISKARLELAKGEDSLYNHPTYKIKDVYFRLGVDPQKMVQNQREYYSNFDTLNFNGLYFLHDAEMKVKPEVIYNSNFIIPGESYQASKVKKTHGLLSGLRIYRFINVSFQEVQAPDTVTGDVKWLQCNVQLVPAKPQSYAIEVEGINSSGNLGAGGNIKYQHKNIFKGAEEFNISFGGSAQNQVTREKEGFNTIEVRAESRIIFPKFWMPFKISSFRKRYNPKTSLGASYNYQRRPDYTRTIANARIGYLWKGNKYLSHSFTPFGLNYVVIPPESLHPDFWDQIKDTYLQYSYQDHLIGGLSYSIVYNEQQVGLRKNFMYASFNFSEGGNLFDLVAHSFLEKKDEGYYEVLGIRYAQFVKGDIDLRYHQYLDQANSVAYRMFIGVGIPYGNLNVLPFEERYFSGGANSIRAWPVRGLGPGSSSSDSLSFYNQVGDIKLEFNIEYRFKMIGALEGALFLDVGNVYNLREEESQPGGEFTFGSFAQKLAVGTGAGMRFDMKYFVFRLDMGVKLKDPVLAKGERWIPANRAFIWDDVAFNFAIGYPF